MTNNESDDFSLDLLSFEKPNIDAKLLKRPDQNQETYLKVQA